MTTDFDEIPTNEEVHEELGKLLSHPDFSGTAIQSNLLKYIVTISLNGEDRTGKELASAVFPGKDPDGTDVRTAISMVRGKLHSYYSADGENDSVQISLPMGRTYRAAFTYRFRPEALRLYERGLDLMRAEGLSTRCQARIYLDLAIEADSSLPGPHLARLELVIIDVLLQHAFAPSRLSIRPFHYRHFDSEVECITLAPRSWLAWCLHGLASVLRRADNEARKAFETALSLNEQRTKDHLSYAFFLLAAGSTEEALLVAQSWDYSNLSEQSILARGLFLFLAGQSTKAMEVLSLSCYGSPEMTQISALLQGLIFISTEQEGVGHRLMFILSQAWDEATSQDMEQGEMLSHVYDYRCSRQLEDGLFWKGFELPRPFAGFNVYALAKLGGPESTEFAEARELIARLESSNATTAFQMAVSWLAVGNKRKALEALHTAIVEGELLAFHFDKWPFLAELNGYPAFEALKQNPWTPLQV